MSAARGTPAATPPLIPPAATGTPGPATPATGRSAGSASPAPERPGFGGRLTAPLLIGSLVNPLNTTMISTALVAIGHSYHVGAAGTAWLISVLYLTSAVAQPVLGKLADSIGPRRVFVAGLVVVLVSGLVGAFALSFTWLLVSRLLLGIGSAAAYPASMSILRHEGLRVGRTPPRPVLARLSFAAVGSTAVGPTLGGVLVMLVGWRGIFAVNVPVALIALVTALRWIPADRPRVRAADGSRPKTDIDPLGIGLFSTALTLLAFFLLDLAHPNWWLLLPFVVVGAVLIRWQLRTPKPFIDLRVLGSNGALTRTYLRHGLGYLLVYCVMYGLTQWLEEVRGFSSGETGLLMLPMSVAALACSLLGARTKGIRGPLTLACLLLTVGSVVLVFLTGDSPLVLLLLAGACFGIPQGLIGTSNQAAVAQFAPAESIGSAAGLQRTAQYIGAITASSMIALAYGQAATDAGLHLMAWIAAGLGVVLIGLTLTDRALRSPHAP
ncbi:MFS transporter [Streptomyces sp. NPDC008125]|uniref:MFS transporter n=1 Tax=Streptomyces sp. NPDC008125 TaxID=3364811 RepID=UPI0036E05003